MKQHVYAILGGRVVELRKPMVRPRKVPKSKNPKPFHVMQAGKADVEFEASTRASAERFVRAFQPYTPGKLRIIDLARSAGLVDVAIKKRAQDKAAPRSESFVGSVVVSRGARTEWLSPTPSMREAISALDRLAPHAWRRQINADHTLDGYYWGPGKGRRVASSQNGEPWQIE